MTRQPKLSEKLCQALLSPGDVAVDGGSHTGRHAFAMLHAVAPGGYVYAFEPLGFCRKQILDFLSDHHPERFELLRLSGEALSDSSGPAEFVIAVDTPAYSGLHERVYDEETRLDHVRVQTCRLDDVISAEHARLPLIVLDLEGGEYHALLGGRETLARYRPVVSFKFGLNAIGEYHVTPEKMADLLESLDYRIRDLDNRQLDRAGFIDEVARQHIWEFIAVPADQPERTAIVNELLSGDGD